MFSHVILTFIFILNHVPNTHITYYCYASFQEDISNDTVILKNVLNENSTAVNSLRDGTQENPQVENAIDDNKSLGKVGGSVEIHENDNAERITIKEPLKKVSSKSKSQKKEDLEIISRGNFKSNIVDIIMFLSQKCLHFLSTCENYLNVLLLIIIPAVFLDKLRKNSQNDKFSKYIGLEQNIYEDVNNVKRMWSEGALQKKEKLLIDIQVELDGHFRKIMNDLQDLYFQVRKVNSDTHHRMHYLLSELKKSTLKIKKNENDCLEEMDLFHDGISLLREEEKLLQDDIAEAVHNIELLQKIINEENLFIVRFFQEIFICNHVQTMIQKNDDPKLRFHYNKIAFSNLLQNLQSLTTCNQLL